MNWSLWWGGNGFRGILKDHDIVTHSISVPLLRNYLWNGDTPRTLKFARPPADTLSKYKPAGACLGLPAST